MSDAPPPFAPHQNDRRREPEKTFTAPAKATGTIGLIDALIRVLDRLGKEEQHLTQPVMSPTITAIVPAMIEVMKKVYEAPKRGRNVTDKYDYVKWADLAALLQDGLALNGLIIAQREIRRSIAGRTLFIHFQFDAYHRSGEYILNITSVTGACRFEFKSGSTDDKAANKCVVASNKAAMLSLFKIPPDDADVDRADFSDPDGQSPHDDRHPEDPARQRDEERGRERDRDDRGGDRRDDRRDERDRGRDERRDTRGGDDWSAPPMDEPPPFSPDGPPPFGPDEPPPGDEPPYGRPGEVSRPADSPEELDFRDSVKAFQRSLDNARDVDEARRVWSNNASLISQMTDATYEYFRANYVNRWNESVPRT